MTPRQIDRIRTSWAAVAPISDSVARTFYGHLFELDPALRRLFAKTDMTAQRQIVMQTFAVIVASLDAIESIVPFIETLGRVHARYGVRDEHYGTVGEALLRALEQALGDGFDQETHDAWATAYADLASMMITAAAEESATAVA
jgi:hemoglobin-like flavoprotein